MNTLFLMRQRRVFTYRTLATAKVAQYLPRTLTIFKAVGWHVASCPVDYAVLGSRAGQAFRWLAVMCAGS